MSRSWMLAAPAALALLVAGCATNLPTNDISPVANVGGGVGNAPGNPVSPNSPAAITSTLTNTEAQSPAPTSPTAAARNRRGMRPSGQTNAAGFGNRANAGATEGTTSGPAPAGRIPAPAQPTGNSGS